MTERAAAPCQVAPPARHLPREDGRRKSAFTLLEILVAVAVLAVLVVLLASIANQVSSVWKSVDAESQRRSAARVLLHNIAGELETIAKPVPMPGANNAVANLQLAVNLPSIPAEALSPHALFWQAPVAQNPNRGGIAQVGYFVRWDTSRPGKAKPQLCRFFVGPDDPANFLVYSTSNGTASDWVSALPRVAPATAPAYQGWLSDHVVALWVRCLDVDGRPITQNAAGQLLNNGHGFDSRQGYREPSTGKIHPAPAFPPVIEIAIASMDSRTANRVKAPLVPVVASPADLDKDANTPGSILHFVKNLPDDVRGGVRIFSTRIVLGANG